MGRRPLAVVVFLAACVLAGCAPGRDDELRGLVDGIAPTQGQMVRCDWEKNWGSAEVEAYYSCSWFVPGTIARVGRPIVSRAVANGFTVYCDGADSSFELSGARGKTALAVEVLARGFTRLRSQHISVNREIPANHVLVSIGAAKLESGAPQGAPEARCVA